MIMTKGKVEKFNIWIITGNSNNGDQSTTIKNYLKNRFEINADVRKAHKVEVESLTLSKYQNHAFFDESIEYMSIGLDKNIYQHNETYIAYLQ